MSTASSELELPDRKQQSSTLIKSDICVGSADFRV